MRLLTMTENTYEVAEFEKVFVRFVNAKNTKYAAVFFSEALSSRVISKNDTVLVLFLPEEYVNRFRNDSLEAYIITSLKLGCLIIDESEERKKGYCIGCTIPTKEAKEYLKRNDDANEAIIKLIIETLKEAKNESN